jgi:hypothetical protein
MQRTMRSSKLLRRVADPGDRLRRMLMTLTLSIDQAGVPEMRRKRTFMCVLSNNLDILSLTFSQTALRQFLRTKKVLPDHGEPPTPPPSSEDVDKFEMLHEGGPVLTSIFMDWPMPFSSLWNQEAISILATAFLESPHPANNSSMEFDPADMTYDNIRKQCVSKLQRTRLEYNRRYASDAMDTSTLDDLAAEKAKAARQDTRRNGVSPIQLHLTKTLLISSPQL